MYTGAASGIFHAAGGGGRAIAKLPAVFDIKNIEIWQRIGGRGGGGRLWGGGGGAHSSLMGAWSLTKHLVHLKHKAIIDVILFILV